MRIAIQGPWSARPGSSSDIQFLRSWLEYDSDLDENVKRGRVNWGMVLGLALAVGVSATCWATVGWIVAHIWK